MLGTVARIALIQGGAMLGAMLEVVGIHRSWSLSSIVGATILFFDSVLLIPGSFASLTIFSGTLIQVARKIADG